MNAWINFKELRAKLDFEQVLKHYKVEVKRNRDQHHGFCPLPDHNGKRNSPSFSANLQRGIFQCFGCGAKGNTLEFAAQMERIDLRNGTAFRELAMRLQSKFCPSAERKTQDSEEQLDLAEMKKGGAKDESPVTINAPLNFELKELDRNHPYLSERRFSRETVERFGLGFCNRGLLKNRIAIPLIDHGGYLIGYAGRTVDDDSIGEDNPKYRFPGERVHKGTRYQFRKTMFLYNGFRFKNPLDNLAVVEGFPSVWWLTQCGIQNVVATMGTELADIQLDFLLRLVKPEGRIWFVPDGDKAGERFSESFLAKVSHHRFVRWVKLSEDIQPSDLSKEQLKKIFAF